MHRYECQYKEMIFHVGDKQFKFSGGVYNTDDKETQEVLDASPFTTLVEDKAPAKTKKAK